MIKRDLTNSNKAIEHIAKLTGMMVEKRDVMNRTRALDEMTEEELAAERARLDAEIAELKKAGEVVPLHSIDGGKDDKSA